MFTTNLVLQLCGLLKKSEVFSVWKMKIRTPLVKSMKVIAPVQQITLAKQKEMSRHCEINTRIQIKILKQLDTWETFLIITSTGIHFLRLSINPSVPGVHLKVTHTWTNLQLKAVGLFKYVWPFSGHQALKG